MAVEFVMLALQFVILVMELDAFAMEFGAFALEFVTFAHGYNDWKKTNQLLVMKWTMEDATLDSIRQQTLALNAVCLVN